MHLNSTQVAGVTAFAVAALATAAAFFSEPRARRSARRGWAVIGAIHLLLAIEVVAMLRHRIEGDVGDWLRTAGEYSGRRPGQLVVILFMVGVAIVVARRLLRRAPSARLAAALGATLALLTLFAVESISLHQVDAIFYRPVGPILIVGWLWIACAAVTTFAAGLIHRR